MSMRVPSSATSHIRGLRARRDERALRKLMTLWEREAETDVEPEESEVLLMIQLSGAVGGRDHGYDGN